MLNNINHYNWTKFHIRHIQMYTREFNPLNMSFGNINGFNSEIKYEIELLKERVNLTKKYKSKLVSGFNYK